MLEVRPAVRNLKRYQPPLGDRLGLRLDFNENTGGCSPRVIERLRELKPEQLEPPPEKGPAVAHELHLAPVEFNITLHGESYHIRVSGAGRKSDGRKPYYIRVNEKLEEVYLEPIQEVLAGVPEQPEAGSTTSPKRPKPTKPGDVAARVEENGRGSACALLRIARIDASSRALRNLVPSSRSRGGPGVLSLVSRDRDRRVARQQHQETASRLRPYRIAPRSARD